jgi:acyl-CoA dehydrogenase
VAPEVFNCNAPDTGNMETLERYGTPEQKKQWLEPLLDGRSARLRDDRAGVASSDATNIQSSIVRDGDDYVDQRPQVVDVGRGRSALRDLHRDGQDRSGGREAPAAIDDPRARDTPGMKILRFLPVFGYDDAPHGHMEIEFRDVASPRPTCCSAKGRGFEIAQGRLGPGRIHHCMRPHRPRGARAREDVPAREVARRVRQPIADQTVTLERIAEARIMIDQARLSR